MIVYFVNKRILWLVFVGLALSNPTYGDSELANFTWKDYTPQEVSTLESTKTSVQILMRDSENPSLKVTYEGPGTAFIPLFRCGHKSLQDGKWLFFAKVRSSEQIDAELEIHYYFEGKAPVSSRRTSGTRHQAISPYYIATIWQPLKLIVVRLPWYTVPEHIELGLSINGPGTAFVEQMRLTRQPTRVCGFGPISLPVAVTLVTCLIAWAVVSTRMVARGKWTRTITGVELILKQVSKLAAILGIAMASIFSPHTDDWGPEHVVSMVGILGIVVLKLNGHRSNIRRT